MPELPEVETFARYFARHALRQRIARVRVLDARVLGEARKERLVRELRGKEFTQVRRHGKNLYAHAGSIWLRLHFGMTGDLAYYRDGDDPRFARVIFDFENGSHLAFEDMRLFGVVDLARNPEAHGLGPDPLDPKFRLADFRCLLEKRRGAIKSLLMSQDIIAGIGNLYADETLFQTSIHPKRAVSDLSATEVRAIFQTMRRILREVIRRHERNREVPANYLLLHREEGAQCPRCGGTIARTVVFGRTTYYCRDHQA
ncbi:MAG TPA: DNA-formamidopyrimidine glycosylase family protein [Thermoanaerobaculia bacterium]|nr:DNA-formamidopyrimidine glycosylase family protein [Thermoanaerobaculia bacterium]